MRIRTNRSRVALRLIVTLAVVLPVVTLLAAPSFASHCTGEGTIRDRGGEVSGECHGSTPGRPGSRDVHELWDAYCAASVGSYQEGDRVEFVETEPLTEGDIVHLGFDPTGEYWWWNLMCWRDGEAVYQYEFAVEVTAPVSPELLRDEATARIDPPAPSPESSPPLARQTFVNVATWLWLDAAGWEPIEVSETQGLTTVTVRATPAQAVWVMGDGGGATCNGPGVEWTSGLAEDATDCSYTYLHSSYGQPEGRFEATVTVAWEFEWWINDTYQGVFGSVDLSTGFAVAVGEIQAVETGG
jgi:hypothetical protein